MAEAVRAPQRAPQRAAMRPMFRTPLNRYDVDESKIPPGMTYQWCVSSILGAEATEQQINAGNFNEAQREIDLLAKADPANFTLTILRSKLDAQRKVADKALYRAKEAGRGCFRFSITETAGAA